MTTFRTVLLAALTLALLPSLIRAADERPVALRPAERLLLDVICNHETRGEERPEWAVSPDGKDWGKCQVRFWSARQQGFSADRSPGDLFIPEVNRIYAGRVLADCRRRLEARQLKPTAVRLSYCYNEGKVAANPPMTSYVKQVALDFALRHLDLVARREVKRANPPR